MSSIDIKLVGITDLDTDSIVNAANTNLAAGSGVCGAIFNAAGYRELQKACGEIGGCPTGSAVITPGFALKAKYIVHAVGPVWNDGNHHEPQDLYSCYRESLNRAKENDCHSIGFPLISAGIFGYPKDKAWRKALQSCNDWINKNPDYNIDIVFAVLDQRICDLGMQVMHDLGITKTTEQKDEDSFVFFWKLGHEHEEFSNWYPREFIIEGIKYNCVEQYMMAKKALLFNDFDIYQKIMHSDDPGECKGLGKLVSNFKSDVWDSCKYEIVFNGNYAKYNQNKELMTLLVATGDAILAEASPYDKVWGIGMDDSDPNAQTPEHWNGQNLLGFILMEIRQKHKAKIYRFAEHYLKLFSDPEAEKYDLDGPEFGDACLALGFTLDSGDALKKHSLEAMEEASTLSKIIDELDDIIGLGSAILSKWRGITHWLQYSSVTDQKNKEWFIVALNVARRIESGMNCEFISAKHSA